MDDHLPRPSLGLVIATQSLLGALFLAGIGAIALLPGFSAMGCLTLLALACITLVLRSLLRHAILMRTELDEVV